MTSMRHVKVSRSAGVSGGSKISTSDTRGAAAPTQETQYFENVVRKRLASIFEAIVRESPSSSRPTTTTTTTTTTRQKPLPKFDPTQLQRYLHTHFNHTASISSTTEAVWEIDDDHDGMISWEEFSTAMLRCLHDAHAREPQQVFNVVLFSVFSEGLGIMPEQQLKKLLYLRFGKARVKEKLVTGFGKEGPYCVGFDAFIRGMSLII